MRIKAVFRSAKPGYYFIVWEGQDQVEYISDSLGELLQLLLTQEGYRQEY